MLVGHVLFLIRDKANGSTVKVFQVDLECYEVVVLAGHASVASDIATLNTVMQVCVVFRAHAFYDQIPRLVVVQSLNLINLDLL